MRQKIYHFTGALAIFGCLGLSIGCSKTGPTGATGPQGAQGPQGPQGPQGNANVFTDTFTVRNKDWLSTSDYWYTANPSISVGAVTRYHDQPFSKVTNDILATGVVMVFFASSVVDSFQWTPLPFQFPGYNINYYYNYAFETMPAKVRLHYFYTTNTIGFTLPDIRADSLAPHKFKIVAISGTVSTSMKHDGVNMQNYGQVANYLNLP
jgi:hypothetical protein